ncbi:MAG: hypothetical protein M3268_09125 [Acidobacteriota bacterium]|nr:hypothetical protein [Acidobacteriota bacterium]
MPSLNARLTIKAALTFAVWLLVFVLSPTSSRAKEWRGITPAQSTRADVVRLLGRCSDLKDSCEFKDDGGDVFIVFAGAVADSFYCAGRLPRDAVMLIDITPKPGLKFPDFGLDESTFRKLLSPEYERRGLQLYEDAAAGVVVEAVSGAVHKISYMADAKDRQACPAYYEHLVSGQVPLCGGLPLVPRMVASYASAAGEERAALDKLAEEMENEPGAQAYVIAYAGRRSRAGEAQQRAERARGYLMGARGMKAGRVVVVDGGYREGAAVELFTVPAGATPPPLTPTVDPKDVEIVPGKTVKKPSNR